MKLKIATRLYLLVTLFLLAIALPQTRLIFEKLAMVRTNKLELAGLHVGSALRNLALRCAMARGASRVYLVSNQTAFVNVRAENLQTMRDATATVDQLETDLALLPETRAKWPEVRESVHAVSKLNFNSAEEGFRIFTNLIQTLDGLDSFALNESTLILDRDPRDFHLITVAFELMNDSSELIGKSRAMASAGVLTGKTTARDRFVFQSLMNQNLEIEKKIQQRMDIVNTRDESIGKTLLPLFREYEAARTDFQSVAQEGLAAELQGEAAASRIFALGTKTIEAQSKFSTEIVSQLEAHFKTRILAAYRDLAITSIVSVLLLGLVFASAFWTVRSIRASIQAASGFAEVVASGNLNDRVRVTNKDEIGEILHSLNRMTEGLAGSVRSIRESSTGVVQSAANLAQTSQQFSATSEQQSAAVEEISAAAEELSASASKMSESVGGAVSRLADTHVHIRNLVDSNQSVSSSLESVISAFKNTSEMAARNEREVLQVTASMDEILSASDKIQEFVRVITEISDRTNLLALNAAIEAARAGEAGRGFAVVASEITRLADLTQKSAKEVQAIIGASAHSIRGGTEKVNRVSINMRAILEGIARVNREANAISDDTKRHTEVVGRMTQNIEIVKQIVLEVHAGAEEQQRAAREVELSITEVAVGSQDNTEGAMKLAALAGDLNQLAGEMRQSAERFIVD
ncbi:MAG: methyl-accepting chemotaxis protein [Spirochaetia bacterium]|nr:methyl-accepting chemotaxis protein [Spirochaetia bacterium]